MATISNKLTVTVELSAEDRARLDHLTAALEALQDAHTTSTRASGATVDNSPTEAVETTTEPQDAPESTPAPAPSPVDDLTPVKDAPPWEEVAASAAPTYTLGDIQQRVVKLSAAGRKDQVREIVKSYAEKVSLIPADKYGEVIARLEALK